ncbi:calcium-dependent secretion activator 2-like isoform X2 [Convolutriloba macropyga]|uniref:calcium-dependent secretion activator 2-like isoform X2 n=1 Tax=Convolutriloba macropyga TaxID=536237 RepID=UPI003F522C95
MIEVSSEEDESETETDYFYQPDSRGLCLPPGYVLPPGRRANDNRSASHSHLAPVTPLGGPNSSSASGGTGASAGSGNKPRNSTVSQTGLSAVSPAKSTPGKDSADGSHSRKNSSTALKLGRSPSPTPSLESKEEKPPMSPADEEQDRQDRYQLYVLVLRGIAYPFNAKQPTDMARRQLKMSLSQLDHYRKRFLMFLKNEMPQIQSDEAFFNAVNHYNDTFLKSSRIEKLVKCGGISAHDFREVFKKMIEKRVASLPDIEGLSKETVLNSWLTKYDVITRGEEGSKMATRLTAPLSETALGKEELYNMFQGVLGIKRYEHQQLYSLMQLDSADEQSSVIRKELNARKQYAEGLAKTKKLPKFLHKGMDQMFMEEISSQIQMLMHNLDCLPVSASRGQDRTATGRPSGFSTVLRTKKTPNALLDGTGDQDVRLCKSDIALSFYVEVTVVEVQNLKNVNGGKIVFCTMEIEGDKRLQTDHAEANKPQWDTLGEFTTSQPLPVLKVRLFTEATQFYQLDDKELGRVVLTINPNFNSNKMSQWFDMEDLVGGGGKAKKGKGEGQQDDDSQEPLKVKLKILMDRPQNIKNCGYLYSQGKDQLWAKLKKRFMVLIQVSQYTFALCYYRKKKSEPSDILQLDGFTVDYSEPKEGQSPKLFYFNAVKEGQSVDFAAENENERTGWITALVRATGQSYRPEPPTRVKSQQIKSTDSAKFTQFINASVETIDHHNMFKKLQTLTLNYRLSDSYSSLGWLSPAQVFLLDEYCARYGVRGCHRHLCYLQDIMDKARVGYLVDPTLIHYSFAFCASHIHGNRPDAIGTVTVDEKERFENLKESLREYLEKQVTNFRYCFPFGRPEGALKATVSLLERVLRETHTEVLMKDVVTPAPPEEVCKVVKKCLEGAALVNYTKISDYAEVEDPLNTDEPTPRQRLERVIRLAELCCEVLTQNDEYHAEAFCWFEGAMAEHSEMFWSMFLVDMNAALEVQPPDSWDSFELFQVLNNWLQTSNMLRNGKFHTQMCDLFAPQLIRYVDLMETSIAQSTQKDFDKEKWITPDERRNQHKGGGGGADPMGGVEPRGSIASDNLIHKLCALQDFMQDINWPDLEFRDHLDQRLKLLAADMIDQAVKKTKTHFDNHIAKGGTGTGYLIPNSICVMINCLLDCDQKADKLTRGRQDSNQYHAQVPELIRTTLSDCKTSIAEKLDAVLESTLSSLARYDETNVLSSVFTFTTNIKSKFSLPAFSKPQAKPGQDPQSQRQQPTAGQDLAQPYMTFVRKNQQKLHELLIDEEYVLEVFILWYKKLVKMMSTWLCERASQQLHIFQLITLSTILKKTYKSFLLEGVMPNDLETADYEAAKKRLTCEETTALMSENASFITERMNDSDGGNEEYDEEDDDY